MSRLPLSLPLLTLFSTCAVASPTLRPLAEVALYPERTAQATVISLNRSRLSAELTAPLAELPVEIGEVVEQGAVVARLDCRDYELALGRAGAGVAAAEARERLAEQQLTRARRLSRDKFAAADLLDNRDAELAVAKADRRVAAAQRDEAQRAVEKCVLRAPFRAVVMERQGQVGELAVPGTPLLTLLDLSRLEVRAEVQQRDAASLPERNELELVGPAGRFPLELIRLSPALNAATRTFEARLRFRDAEAPAGASGTVRWRDPRPHVPAELLVSRDDLLGVFVAAEGRAHFLPVAGAVEGRPAAVTLPADTRLVVEGQAALAEGGALR